MCLIAIGDSYTAVLTRSMRDSHFSILLFWFAALGFLIQLSYESITIAHIGKLPAILEYNLLQVSSMLLSGFFSACNITCLTIAY